MFTAVTVAFAKEKPVLRLQARSMDRFVDWVDDIVLIDNEPNGCNLQDIVPWYGKHADKVRVLHARDIMGEPGPNPYYDQMVLKILSYKFCHNYDIVILDSKNWFIKCVELDRITPNGKYLGEAYPLTEPWHSAWNNSLRLLNLNVDEFGSLPVSCRTPFFVGKDILEFLDISFDIKNLISIRRRFTEFSLINACVLSKHESLRSYFQFENHLGYCSGVWPGYVPDESISERLLGSEFRNSHIFCTGMHRNVWNTLDQATRDGVINGWILLGLMDYNEATELFNEMVSLNLINR